MSCHIQLHLPSLCCLKLYFVIFAPDPKMFLPHLALICHLKIKKVRETDYLMLELKWQKLGKCQKLFLAHLTSIGLIYRFSLGTGLHPDWMLMLFFIHTHLTVTVTLGLLLIPKVIIILVLKSIECKMEIYWTACGDYHCPVLMKYS